MFSMRAVTRRLHHSLILLAAFQICGQKAICERSDDPVPAAAGLAGNDSQAGPAGAQDTFIRVSSNLVMVPVSVTSVDGNPVQDLEARDFAIEENGKAQPIARMAEPGQVSVELVLLFDISGSVNHRFLFEQRAAAEFLELLVRPGDGVTLYSIGAEPRLLMARTSDLQTALASLLALVPTRSPTAFFDAVVLAARSSGASAGIEKRRVAIVLSDGEDNNSEQYGLPDALRAVQEADCIFYAINPMGATVDINKVSLEGQRAMDAIARQTGGMAFLPETAEQLPAIFGRIAAELRAQYLLEYYSTDARTDGSFRTILVRVPDRPDLRIRARQGYYAPRSEPRPGAALIQAPAVGRAEAPAAY
jgi:Ca-activated chloride channel family protein